MKAKKIISYFILFLILISAELLLLTGAAMLPKDSIRENVLSSAEYLNRKAPFFRLVQSDASSRIDRHADAILVNLAWSCDAEKPLASALRSSYYYDALANENVNLLHAVQQDSEPTYDYMRYWHGSLVILRPLLVFFTLPQIYVLGGIVLAVLFLFAAVSILRAYGKMPFFGFLLAASLCSLWYVPFSLEYMPVFLISFAAVPVTIAVQRRNPSWLGILFFILGSLTAYTDFLTTETLTCLLPLSLVLLKDCKKPFSRALSSALLWLTAYSATWSTKWILYSVNFRENGISDALAQTAYRTGGEAVSGGIVSQISGALIRNLRCLFPFSLCGDSAGMLMPILTLVLCAMVFWVIRKQNGLSSVVFVYFFIGLVPYIRYALLSNHAYIHYFFTFRAQFSSVFCLFLIFTLGTDYEFLKKEFKKIKCKK